MNNKDIDLINDKILESRKKEYEINKKIKILNYFKAFNIPAIGLGLCGIAFATLLAKFNPTDIAFAKEMMNLSIFMESIAIPYSITTTIIAKRYMNESVLEEKYLINLSEELDKKSNKPGKEKTNAHSLSNNKEIDSFVTNNDIRFENICIEETPMRKVKQLKK